MTNRSMKLLTLAAAICLPGATQTGTKVDLKVQSKRVDFTQADSTRPLKMGSSLPASCSLGDLFFKSDALIGTNLFGCVATNVWVNLVAPSLPAQAGAAGGVLSTNGSSADWTNLSGDITGAPASALVRALQNRPVAATAPEIGHSLVWDGTAWQPQAVAGQSVTLRVDGVTIGSRAAENFLSGAGILSTIADSGTELTIQHSIDSAVVQTRAGLQSGATLLCSSVGGSSTAYSCSMSPTLTAYTVGMLVQWKPDVAGTGGPVTLDIDALGARPIKLADGLTDPTQADFVAGSLYDLWFDGSSFRLRSPVAVAAMPTQPSCAEALRGRLWYTTGTSGNKDSLAVCAKDASDAYAWQTLY